jgi:peptidoglycan hydrolase-like amidase
MNTMITNVFYVFITNKQTKKMNNNWHFTDFFQPTMKTWKVGQGCTVCKWKYKNSERNISSSLSPQLKIQKKTIHHKDYVSPMVNVTDKNIQVTCSRLVTNIDTPVKACRTHITIRELLN